MRIRVLVVDDFPMFREGTVAALRADPAFVVVGEAGDAIEAAELARRHGPDVVLLDMMMPGCRGPEAVQLIRRQAPRARVLAISASAHSNLVSAALAAGAQGYLTKFAQPAELRQALVKVHGGGKVISDGLAAGFLRGGPGGSADARDGDVHHRPLLSERENEVLALVTRGCADADVAAALGIRLRTVQSHLARIREKTGRRRRSELVIWAMRHGMR